MNWEKYRQKLEPVNRWVEDARQAGGDITLPRHRAGWRVSRMRKYAASLNFELAGIYKMAGRYDEAERIYPDALRSVSR